MLFLYGKLFLSITSSFVSSSILGQGYKPMGALTSLFFKITQRLPPFTLVPLFLGLVMLSGCSSKRDQELTPDHSLPSPAHPITTSSLASPLLQEPENAPSFTRRIGVLLPLTGNHAPLGDSLLKAIELSLLEANSRSIELVIQDTGSTESGAQKGAQALFQKGPIDCILGPIHAPDVTAITPLAWEKGIPILAFSNADSVAGNNIFIMGYSPKDQMDILLDYAFSQRVHSLLLIIPQSPYGTLISQSVRQKVVSVPSLTLFDTLTYGDPSTLAETLSLIDFSKVEGILIPEGGEILLTILSFLEKNASYTAAKPKLLGSGQWEDEKLFSQPALKGGVFSSTSLGAKERFKDKFLKAFGTFPDNLSALGYDGLIALSANLSVSVLDSLLNPQGFDGANGHFSFTLSGHIERVWKIYEVSPSAPGGVVDITPSAGHLSLEEATPLTVSPDRPLGTF